MHNTVQYPHLPYDTAKALLGRINTLIEPLGFHVATNFSTKTLPFPKKETYVAFFESLNDSSLLHMGIKMHKREGEGNIAVIMGAGKHLFTDIDPTRLIHMLNDYVYAQRFPVTVYPEKTEQTIPESLFARIGHWRFDPQTNTMSKWKGE